MNRRGEERAARSATPAVASKMLAGCPMGLDPRGMVRERRTGATRGCIGDCGSIRHLIRLRCTYRDMRPRDNEGKSRTLICSTLHKKYGRESSYIFSIYKYNCISVGWRVRNVNEQFI